MRTSPQVLAAACLAQLMVTLDVSVVNIALPSIRDDFGLGVVGQQWIVTAYALPFAGFLLLGGRVADVVGVRRVFLAGTSAFVAASLIAGVAPGPEVLLAGRAAQGLAAAVLAPATLTAITGTFPEGDPRTRAMAWWTATSIAGGAAGNLSGGVLTEFLGWRSTLLVNVPLGVLALVLAARVLPAARREGGRIDTLPALLVTAGLLVLAYGLSTIGGRRWAPGVMAVFLASALFAAFVRRDGTARNPLLPRALLAIRSVRLGNAGLLLAGTALVPMWFFLTLQLQVVLGYSPLMSGLAFLPHTLIQLGVGLWLTPRLLRRAPAARLVLVGGALLAAGFAWQSTLTAGSTYVSAVLLPAVLIAGGAGLLTLPLSVATVAGVAETDRGAASGIMNSAKQIGGGVGLAAVVGATSAATQPAQAYQAAFTIMAAVAVVIAVGAAAVARAGP